MATRMTAASRDQQQSRPLLVAKLFSDGGKKLFGAVAILAAIMIGLYAAWSWIYPSGTLRYRLTVEVEADGKVHTGSGVIEARYEIPPPWLLSASRVIPSVKGEAVAVDLGARGTLFVLLKGEPPAQSGGYVADPEAMPVREFNLAPSIGSLKESTVRSLGRLNAHAEVPSVRLPMMVTFAGLNDPKSVIQVRPDDLSATFGPGVRLRRATVEATKDGITRGIEQKLPWIMGLKGVLGGQLQPDRARPERNLTGNDFVKGIR